MTTTTDDLFCDNSRIAFDYPRHNFYGVLSKLEPRRLQVTAIRDLTCDPIEGQTFELNPLLKRGLLLVTGIDLDKGQERSFYVESMRRVKRIEG